MKIVLGTDDTWLPSPNFYKRRFSPLRGIMLHSSNGQAASLEAEYEATRNWIVSPQSEVSYHCLIGPEQTSWFVDPLYQAWHAEENNRSHLAVALALPALPFILPTSYMLDKLASVCYTLSSLYGLPLRRATSQYQAGIIQHLESEQGMRRHKIDIGSRFGWEQFLHALSLLSLDLDRARSLSLSILKEL